MYVQPATGSYKVKSTLHTAIEKKEENREGTGSEEKGLIT